MWSVIHSISLYWDKQRGPIRLIGFCWFLSLRVFGLLSSSLLLFPQRFSRYVLRPSSGVYRTREPSRNFGLRLSSPAEWEKSPAKDRGSWVSIVSRLYELCQLLAPKRLSWLLWYYWLGYYFLFLTEITLLFLIQTAYMIPYWSRS